MLEILCSKSQIVIDIGSHKEKEYELNLLFSARGRSVLRLFSCIREMNPREPLSKDKIDISDFVRGPHKHCNTVSDVEMLLANTELGNRHRTFHLLFADLNGNSIALAEQNGNITITSIDGKFIIMTNFPNASLEGKSYIDMRGVGADRYIILHEYLTEHYDGFDVYNAMKALQKASQSHTRYSAIYNPGNMKIYLSTKGNYDYIWKICLIHETIETNKGFNTPLLVNFNEYELSIPFTTLTNYEQTDTIKLSNEIKSTLEIEDHVKYINGYLDGTVHPNGSITCAEVAMIFFRLLKAADKNNAVAGGECCAQAVKYLARLGIIKGYKDGSFGPQNLITRAEFATIASRFDDVVSGINNPLSGVPADHWAYTFIISAYAKGWISGYPGGEFQPSNSIIRAEVVKIE